MALIERHPFVSAICGLVCFVGQFLFCIEVYAGPEDSRPFAGRLVFFGQGKQGANPPATRIVSIFPDGSDLRVEFDFDRDISGGSIAPNGRKLAFISRDLDQDTGELSEIGPWIIEPGQQPRRLPCHGYLYDWHPSGDSLLVYRKGPDGHENLSVDVDTGESKTLVLPDNSVAQAWMHTGDKLVVIAMNPGRRYNNPTRGSYPLRQLFLWTPQTGGKSVFTNPEHDCIWPVPSPDGRMLAFYLRRHTDRPHEFLAIADNDGNNVREVTKDLIEKTESSVIRVHGFPRWSPDGSEIAWLRTIKDAETNRMTYELIFISIDGGEIRRLPLDEDYVWLGQFDWGR